MISSAIKRKIEDFRKNDRTIQTSKLDEFLYEPFQVKKNKLLMYLAKPAASRLWANITFDNITSPVTKTVHVLNGTTKQSNDLLEILCNILKKSTRKEKNNQTK